METATRNDRDFIEFLINGLHCFQWCLANGARIPPSFLTASRGRKWCVCDAVLRDEDAIKACVEEYMYRNDYLAGLEQEQCTKIGLRLFNEGKVFQPRLQGIRAFRIPEGAIWADLFPTNVSESDAVKKAWEAYRFMLHMTAQVHEDLKEHLS
jgi:hypothetical protein